MAQSLNVEKLEVERGRESHPERRPDGEGRQAAQRGLWNVPSPAEDLHISQGPTSPTASSTWLVNSSLVNNLSLQQDCVCWSRGGRQGR